ncbi:DUF2332 domain-containing protein [Shimia sp. R9_2]|uniref:DUF2332 domain-containing protein n=1 Tax=Shimia sp. R9_2 TaxID=2821112 RepID=UPI001ADA4B26|nr:DUF2332 domain-containing protein [Shimia sp. R9_2]MBO9397459.1 DUF2332 domain-containing protein [Shimia sp. R9_2]
MNALSAAFLEQADSCDALDSPFMGRLLRMLSANCPTDTALAKKCATFAGDIGPKGHSLPLRIASGLHALVLKQTDPALATVYPPNAPADPELQDAVLAALHRHDAFLCDWITNAPQTNEVRRSAVLIATAQLLTARFGLPLKLSELGASAGLNLMFDQFHLAVGDGYGPKSDVVLTPDWHGVLPPQDTLSVVDRRGVDLHPLNSHDPDHALRLQAYLWADQAERITRTRAAIAVQDAEVDASDAIDWLEARVAGPQSGALHLVYSTVAWQYFPPQSQTRGIKIMEAAGAKATEAAPLAWLSYEADEQTPGAALTLRLWPGDVTINLGRADFHGRWVDWQAPEKLT